MDFKVFNSEETRRRECALKHKCSKLNLLNEYLITIVSEQLMEAKTADVADSLYIKLRNIASMISDVEEDLDSFFNMFLLKDPPEKTMQPKVTMIDIHQFCLIYGEFTQEERHFEDYIKSEEKKLSKSSNADEKKAIKERILMLTNELDTTRLTRKKFLDGFVEH